jgi:hypothetical protein
VNYYPQTPVEVRLARNYLIRLLGIPLLILVLCYLLFVNQHIVFCKDDRDTSNTVRSVASRSPGCRSWS